MSDKDLIRRGEALDIFTDWSLGPEEAIAELRTLPAAAPTLADALALPEVQALVEAVDHLLVNYLQDEFDEPDLCVDEDHWLAIYEARAALATIKGGA